MARRTLRVVAVFFAVAVMLAACEFDSPLRLSEGSAADDRAAVSDAASGATDDDDDGGDTSDTDATDDDDGGDTSDTDDGVGASDTDATDDGRSVDGAVCNHEIPSDMEEADGAGNLLAVGPGDVVCLQAGRRDVLELHNFHGEAGEVITFVNDGGTVDIRGGSDDYAGIEIENSDHIRVTGTGESSQCGADHPEDAQRCGISVLGSARSVTGKVRTEHVEIDHVEMGDTTQSAVSIKDNDLDRGEWVAHDVVLRHNYVHDVYDEGMYVGSSDYKSGDPHLFDGVHLSHNLVVDTGRDGLQVGSATRDCTIHHNVIKNSGLNDESDHRAGVMNNKGSVCNIYNNYITDTEGWGIYVQGNGTNEIYNNVVVRAGRSVEPGDKDGDGIAIHDGSNVRNSIYVWNNTIVSAAGDGIGWDNDPGSDNQVRNNLVVDSGGANIDRDSHVQVEHNVTAAEVSAAGFVDAASDDYRLRPGSPAVDEGVSLQTYGVVDDLDGRARPQGSAYDIGAYELPADGD
jgi:parallel beta-helix repeat protein